MTTENKRIKKETEGTMEDELRVKDITPEEGTPMFAVLLDKDGKEVAWFEDYIIMGQSADGENTNTIIHILPSNLFNYLLVIKNLPEQLL